MIKLSHFFLLICFFLKTVLSAPICDNQVNLGKKVKRKVVKVTRTVATVSSTDYSYTSTHTVTAPLVEVIISGDLTYTVTLTTNVPSGSGGQTVTHTSSVESQASIGSAVASAAANAHASNNGGFISSYSSSSVSSFSTSIAVSYNVLSSSQTVQDTITAVPSSLASSGSLSSSAAAASSSESSSSPNSASAPASASSESSYASSVGSSSSVTSFSSSSVSSTTSSAARSSSNDVVASSSDTSTSSSSTPSSASSASSNPFACSTIIPEAIVYSPYNDDGSCKDYDTVEYDLNVIAGKQISVIRIYGNDCNYLTSVLPIADSLGLKVNQGFWFDSTDIDPIQEDAAALVAYAQSADSGWDVFEFITIGNEAINGGYMDASQLITIINTITSTLRDGGYTGSITTSEPPITFEDFPELCSNDVVDFVGINPHSYFDTSVDASQAGDFVVGQQQIVENVCPGMQVVITETGYPSQGDTNGLNVPSTENQKIAIASILESTGGAVTILTMYNDMWKDPGSYGIEQYFGAEQILA